MVFRITSPIVNQSQSHFWILQGARLTVATYNLTPAQKQLDEYIWKKFGLNLKAACALVVANCRIQKNSSNELLITFPSKKIDDLAAIITYGNGKIQGCPILVTAFGRH